MKAEGQGRGVSNLGKKEFKDSPRPRHPSLKFGVFFLGKFKKEKGRGERGSIKWLKPQ